MSLETMTKLLSTTVGVGGAASITFSNIPQGYTDLKIVASARTNTSRASNGMLFDIRFNDITTGYSRRSVYAESASAASASASDSYTINASASDYTANVFSNCDIYVSNYSANTFKAVSADSVSETNGTGSIQMLASILWSNSAPITTISFTPLAGSFVQFTTFTIYGIKNLKRTMPVPGWSTGGILKFDGTYFYHVFTSTDIFMPSKPLTADILVVAGGGGGAYDQGGGGGAGGYLTFENQSLLPTPYVCAVGAGGSQVTNGANSQFGLLTTAIGGGAGKPYTQAGSSGGSGGGQGGSGSGGGGAGTAGQGNAGGAGSVGGGGGGGGAGAAGSVGGSNGGNGGNGLFTAISGGATTGFGQLSGGNYYFAGGGGGGNEGGTPSRTPGIGGLGGGGNASDNNPLTSGTNGSPNTGGGGGGSANSTGTAYAGGSGIVIIRYKG